ncbi:hypothetical protein [Calidifontibacillus erzurumensis]|uniref:PD-(D/E)XK nuclease superfamily protein n=1 Tax=Calidifontibacillus erzurumensis TaxID=2741433 RepID=A0A8J8GAP3_9BACI|nr:hypothetical protein [Calidifontibacillus erzurumensis]NSL50222.1 hypothetical protein [Calidifontibacillus erzurumensis]
MENYLKVITTDYIESLIRCPHKFFHQHHLSFDTKQEKRRKIVQQVINQVIKEYYLLLPEMKNKFNFLKLIDKYWKNIHPNIFESRADYYIHLAKITDHLLQFLTVDRQKRPPLFLYQTFNAYIEDLGTELSLTFEVGEWTKDSFIVKKFLVEADEYLMNLYHNLIVVFSHEAFGKLPEKIEMITLLEGKKHTLPVTSEQVTRGKQYLSLLKNFLKQPNKFKIEIH